MSVALFLEPTKLDFDKALQYFVVKKLKTESIVSFDRDFDNFNLQRLEPNQII